MWCRWILTLCGVFLLGVGSPRNGLAGEKKGQVPVKHQPTLVAQLEHSLGVSSASLSGDGKWLVTGSWDHTARLWEAATGKEVRAFKHSGQIKSVLLSGGDHRGRLAAGIRVAKQGVKGYWLELHVDNSKDAVIELAKKYVELKHEAKGDWPGGQPPFKHPCPDRPQPKSPGN